MNWLNLHQSKKPLPVFIMAVVFDELEQLIILINNIWKTKPVATR